MSSLSDLLAGLRAILREEATNVESEEDRAYAGAVAPSHDPLHYALVTVSRGGVRRWMLVHPDAAHHLAGYEHTLHDRLGGDITDGSELHDAQEGFPVNRVVGATAEHPTYGPVLVKGDEYEHFDPAAEMDADDELSESEVAGMHEARRTYDAHALYVGAVARAAGAPVVPISVGYAGDLHDMLLDEGGDGFVNGPESRVSFQPLVDAPGETVAREMDRPYVHAPGGAAGEWVDELSHRLKAVERITGAPDRRSVNYLRVPALLPSGQITDVVHGIDYQHTSDLGGLLTGDETPLRDAERQAQEHDSPTLRRAYRRVLDSVPQWPSPSGDTTRRFAEGDIKNDPHLHLDHDKHRWVRNEKVDAALGHLTGLGFRLGHDLETGGQVLRGPETLDALMDAHYADQKKAGVALGHLHFHGPKAGVRLHPTALDTINPTFHPYASHVWHGRNGFYEGLSNESVAHPDYSMEHGPELPTPEGMTQDEHLSTLASLFDTKSAPVAQLGLKKPTSAGEASTYLRWAGLLPERFDAGELDKAHQHLERLGTMPPAELEGWVDGMVNRSVSQGGFIDDSKLDERWFSPRHAFDEVKGELGVQGKWEDHLQEKGKREELWDDVKWAGRKLAGQHPWGGSGNLEAFEKPLDELKVSSEYHGADFHRDFVEEGQPETIRDVSRYLENPEPRMVVSVSKNGLALALHAGHYRYSRYDTFGGDGMRLDREDKMGIGRVSYAALGWEAPHTPVVGLGNGTEAVVKDERASGQSASFGVEAYGNTIDKAVRLSFAIPDTVSHAINDTYYDPRHCPEGGRYALPANALAFAALQQSDDRLAHPSNGQFMFGQMPNFLELHVPGDIEMAGLTHAAFSDLLDGNALSDSSEARVREVLRRTQARVSVTPIHPHFYHPDSPVGGTRFEKGQRSPRTTLGEERSRVGMPVHTEQQARLRVERTVEHLMDQYGTRVRLAVPQWYVREYGSPYIE